MPVSRPWESFPGNEANLNRPVPEEVDGEPAAKASDRAASHRPAAPSPATSSRPASSIHGRPPANDLSGAQWLESFLLGSSLAMRKLRALLVRYAGEVDPVLVMGESGTGKSLVARALHGLSPRRSREPVTAALAGCGDTSRDELFGSRKGAYTGSIADHPGLFKQADGSSLILEDAPDLPPAVQAMLLRAIEEKRFRPMQAVQEESADVRVIVTSNRPLDEEVKKGRFRLDLYHRLRVLRLLVPPLRERIEDLNLYVPHFLRVAAAAGKGPKRMSEGAMELLREYRWPGNVRELANVLREATLRSDDPLIGTEELRELLPFPGPQPKRPPMIPLDKAVLLHTLLQTGWNKKEAARKLSISRAKLYRLLEKHRIMFPASSGQ